MCQSDSDICKCKFFLCSEETLFVESELTITSHILYVWVCENSSECLAGCLHLALSQPGLSRSVLSQDTLVQSHFVCSVWFKLQSISLPICWQLYSCPRGRLSPIQLKVWLILQTSLLMTAICKKMLKRLNWNEFDMTLELEQTWSHEV